RVCLSRPRSLGRLPRLIGLARAKELILLGEPVSARTAERYGVVHRVVEAAEFPRAFEATLERFLALPPASARASKVLSTRAFDVDFEAFRKEMETLLAGCLASDEHRRAMAAIRASKPRARCAAETTKERCDADADLRGGGPRPSGLGVVLQA